MDTITKVVGGLVLVFVLAVFMGTILYFIWPVVIPALLPSLVMDGIVAGKLSWWVAVCTTWLFGILFKSSAVVNKG